MTTHLPAPDRPTSRPPDASVAPVAPATRGAIASPPAGTGTAHRDGEDGSLVTEYGLVAVVGATIAGVAVRWASGGAITELLGAVLTRIRAVVGV